METLTRVHTLLALDPVVVGLLSGLVLIRLAIAGSLRRRYRPRVALPRRGSLREGLLEWVDSGLLALLSVFLVVRPFVAQILPVTSPSMAPTLNGGPTPQIDGPNDRILVNKYLLHCRPPRRGEVVVFLPPPASAEQPDALLVKRLVALPGDTVEIDQLGRLLVNDLPVDEPYLREPSDIPFPRRELPAGSYFVLGDNRNLSNDSSRWSGDPFLPAERLMGTAVAICWPPERLRLLP